MIWIPLNDLEYPSSWHTESREAQAVLEDCKTARDRSEMLDENVVTRTWGKPIRNSMSKLSNNKCWYCETPLDRDDLVVDHYRPKGRVYEEPPSQEGYWWLAASARNFRLSCTFCNERRVDPYGGTSGGKRTHFPLLKGGIRATAANRDTSMERPVILDPIHPLDPPLLKFLKDSWVEPFHELSEDPDKHDRATQTIDILHLNHERIRRRRGQICNAIDEAIERTETFYRRYLDYRKTVTDDQTISAAYSAYEASFERLADYVKRTSPYAGAAKSIIRQHGGPGREWLHTLLQL